MDVKKMTEIVGHLPELFSAAKQAKVWWRRDVIECSGGATDNNVVNKQAYQQSDQTEHQVLTAGQDRLQPRRSSTANPMEPPS